MLIGTPFNVLKKNKSKPVWIFPIAKFSKRYNVAKKTSTQSVRVNIYNIILIKTITLYTVTEFFLTEVQK